MASETEKKNACGNAISLALNAIATVLSQFTLSHGRRTADGVCYDDFDKTCHRALLAGAGQIEASSAVDLRIEQQVLHCRGQGRRIGAFRRNAGDTIGHLLDEAADRRGNDGDASTERRRCDARLASLRVGQAPRRDNAPAQPRSRRR